MEAGFIGSGKMSFPPAKKLLQAGIKIIAWDHDENTVEKYRIAGGLGHYINFHI